MADLDLDELERLIAAASPRPWRIEPLLRDYLAGAVAGDNRNVADMRRADAWLVVALANAAPALIAAARERDRLRALCREAADLLERCIERGGDAPHYDGSFTLARLRAAGGGT